MTTTEFTAAEDKGYRRGFDQGVAAMASVVGISNNDLQLTAWKQRVKAFRRREVESTPWEATPAERAELLNLLNTNGGQG